MKNGSYTTTLPIELEFIKPDGDNFYKEFNVTFTADWANDGIGRYEYGSAVCFDKGHDYLEQINDWKIEDDVTKEEKAAIEDYIDKNEDKILEQMTDSYEPYWNYSY